jgi:putative ABC transport system substrate-binding protein
MRNGELIANFVATARAFRVLAALAIGLASFAHEGATQEPVRRIAVLAGVPVPEVDQMFRDELHARGHDEGRNLQIISRYTQGQLDRIPALVAELVALHPDVLAVAGPQIALAVRDATPTIPIVFYTVADPVGLGLVPNLAHPGGNVTGIATMVPDDFGAKVLQLLKTAAPTASRIAVLLNPKNPLHKRDDVAAQRLGVELVTVQASKVEELEAAFQDANAKGAEAIDVIGDTVTFRGSAKIANLCLQYRLPSIYLFRQNVLDGGLMSYGPNAGELVRAWARQIDKVLKGAKPGDLPVEQPTRFDLSINLTTAKALGITIPATLLAEAAELVE